MKKNKTISILLLALIIISLLIYINIDKIRFGLSMLDIYNKSNVGSKTDSNVETNPKKEVVLNPLDKIIVENKPVDRLVDNSNEKIVDSKELPTENTPIQENINRPLQNIVSEYNEMFLTLQNEFESEITKLLDTAVYDYNSGISKVTLVDSYLDKGSNLEKSSDGKFYSLLSKFEKELIKNSHNTQVINDVESYYKNFKKEKKTSLIEKGMSIVESKN